MKLFKFLLIFFVSIMLQKSNTSEGKRMYTVLERHSTYQVRSYGSGYYVETNFTAPVFIRYRYPAIKLLNRYIRGRNDKNQKIIRDGPIFATFYKRACAYCKQLYSVRFHLPNDTITSGAPQPRDSRVKVVFYPKTEYYVRKRRGTAKNQYFQEKAVKFKSMLTRLSVTSSSYEGAFFNIAIHNRGEFKTRQQNEILFKKL